MPRLIDAFEQFFDSSGEVLASGLVDFFVSGSNTVRKTTFADSGETIPNPNPVVLNGDGRAPNIFGSGTYRSVLRTSAGTQILFRDPVGGTQDLTFGADWDAARVYSVSDVVRDDGQYWISQTNNNTGNRPSIDSGTAWQLATLDRDSLFSITSIATYADMNEMGFLPTGASVTLTGEGISGDWVVEDAAHTANVGTIRDWNNAVGNQYLKRLNIIHLNARWFEPAADWGAQINAATAAGFKEIYTPPGTYTQSTQLTPNVAVKLYSDFWDEFGTPPVIIQKDGNFAQVDTQGEFTSLGIRYDGNSVAGGADGVIIRGKFHFIGQVVGGTGNGLVLREEAADNLNNSIFGGAFSGNSVAQILLETTHLSGSDALDINTILSKYIRCNSGRVGLHIKGGLWNAWQYVNLKGNTEIGVLLEAENVISNNTFRIYSENTAGGAIDFYAVDGWSVFGSAPTRTGDTTFTVTGDQTTTFTAGKKIRFIDDSVTYWGTIDSSVFTSLTTVTVTVAGNVALTSNLTEVATDAAANLLKDNDFVQCRGLTKDDVYIENGNTFLAASSRQGIITNAEQPWVKAFVSSDQLNVTGDGTAYTVAFDTETKDTQNNFDTSTFTFTAPLTGRYRFEGCVGLQGLAAGSHTRCRLQLITTGLSYALADLNLDNYKSASNVAVLPFSMTASMSSSHTATLRLTISNGALDVDISGSAIQTWIDIVLEG